VPFDFQYRSEKVLGNHSAFTIAVYPFYPWLFVWKQVGMEKATITPIYGHSFSFLQDLLVNGFSSCGALGRFRTGRHMAWNDNTQHLC